MGLYDREYYREEETTGFAGQSRSVVVTLILINVGIFIVDFFSRGQLSEIFRARSDILTRPWYAWQLLTAGFIHSTRSIWHIVFNMYGLWLFGREVEEFYGRREFLRLYLILLILSTLTWVLYEDLLYGFAQPLEPHGYMLGASGAVTGISVIYACHFPKRILLVMGIFPAQTWVVVGVFLLLDLLGATSAGDSGTTAYAAHLGGAAFGYWYYRSRINFGKLFQFRAAAQWLKRRPKLHLRRAEDDDRLNLSVDRILEKISKQGEASLTRAERRTLESASRRYQERRR